MGGQGFITILEKKNIKSWFKFFRISPLNLAMMVGKFIPSDVFITTK